MRPWVLALVALAACAEDEEDEARPCMGSTRWLDAGTHWRHLELPDAVTTIDNATIEALDDGGSRLTFTRPGPFRVVAGRDNPCGEQRVWNGMFAERPVEVPRATVDAVPARPGNMSSGKFELINLTDDGFDLELDSNDARFVPLQLIGRHLPARAARQSSFGFRPTEFGRADGRITVNVRDWSGGFDVGGFSGGPVIIAPTIVEAGLVAHGVQFTRPDVRTFTIENGAGATEDAFSNLLFYGEPRINGCDGLLSLSPLPPRIEPANSHRGLLFITPTVHGTIECPVRLTSQFATIDFRVRWNTVDLPPCDLQTDATVVLDGGTATVQLTALNDVCYFTYPHFEPADAGHLDIDWSTFMLDGGATLTVPIVASGEGAVVLNVNRPTGVVRIEVKK